MTEDTQIASASGSVAEAEPTRDSPQPATLRHLFITFLSAAFPGLGHILLRQVAKGMILSASFVALLCCFWPLRLLRFYPGFVALYCGWLVLSFYSSCNAQLTLDPRTGSRISKWWLTVTVPITLVIVSLIGAGITRASGFRSFEIPSTSMEPTIQRGDRIVVDTRAFRSRMPQYREVVIFYRERTFFTKRIIGMGGDTIEGRDGSILVNGNVVNESYVQHSSAGSVVDWRAEGNGWMQNFGPVAVPNGKYFVLGDNRDVSLDSRSPDFGFVDRPSVTGKVLYVYSSAREGTRVR